MNTTTTNSGTKLNAIQRAIAEAKARKAAAAAMASDEAPKSQPQTAPQPKVSKPKAEPKASSVEPRDEARAKRDAERVERLNAKAAKLAAEDAAKAARKAERQAAKAEKAAAKASASVDKKPAHMKKVERARAKCPTLSADMQRIFDEVTTNFSAAQLDALAQHLTVHNRAMATIRANQVERLPLGATVRITGGEAKFIGMVGVVEHSHKLRAKVKVPGVAKLVYIFNGQAELVSDAASHAA